MRAGVTTFFSDQHVMQHLYLGTGDCVTDTVAGCKPLAYLDPLYFLAAQLDSSNKCPVTVIIHVFIHILCDVLVSSLFRQDA